MTKTPNRFREIVRADTTVLECGGAFRHDKTTHNFYILLDDDIDFLNAQGMRDGDEINVIIQQDGSGSHTVHWGDMWLFSGGEPTLTSTANLSHLVRGIYNESLGKIVAHFLADIATSASPSASPSPSSSASSSVSRSPSPSSSASRSVSPSSSASPSA